MNTDERDGDGWPPALEDHYGPLMRDLAETERRRQTPEWAIEAMLFAALAVERDETRAELEGREG